jgi:predicted metal-dependent hydrolase
MYNARHIESMNIQLLAQPRVVGIYDISLNGQTVSYILKRSLRARLIWLNIKRQTGLTVTVPRCYNLNNLPGYLKSNSLWILRNLVKFCGDKPVSPVVPVQPSNTISYLGKCLTVTQDQNSHRVPSVKLQQDKLIVNFSLPGEPVSSEKLDQWLKTQATKVIKKKVNSFSQQMELVYNRVVIRDQKSRWGSCSCRRNLNFNWRLIKAPEPVLDYVIIHELCHLKEMSHSKAFWAMVAQYCPQWYERRDWLNKHCLELNASIHL